MVATRSTARSKAPEPEKAAANTIKAPPKRAPKKKKAEEAAPAAVEEPEHSKPKGRPAARKPTKASAATASTAATAAKAVAKPAVKPTKKVVTKAAPKPVEESPEESEDELATTPVAKTATRKAAKAPAKPAAKTVAKPATKTTRKAAIPMKEAETPADVAPAPKKTRGRPPKAKTEPEPVLEQKKPAPKKKAAATTTKSETPAPKRARRGAKKEETPPPPPMAEEEPEDAVVSGAEEAPVREKSTPAPEPAPEVEHTSGVSEPVKEVHEEMQIEVTPVEAFVVPEQEGLEPAVEVTEEPPQVVSVQSGELPAPVEEVQEVADVEMSDAEEMATAADENVCMATEQVSNAVELSQPELAATEELPTPALAASTPPQELERSRTPSARASSPVAEQFKTPPASPSSPITEHAVENIESTSARTPSPLAEHVVMSTSGEDVVMEDAIMEDAPPVQEEEQELAADTPSMQIQIPEEEAVATSALNVPHEHVEELAQGEENLAGNALLPVMQERETTSPEADETDAEPEQVEGSIIKTGISMTMAGIELGSAQDEQDESSTDEHMPNVFDAEVKSTQPEVVEVDSLPHTPPKCLGAATESNSLQCESASAKPISIFEDTTDFDPSPVRSASGTPTASQADDATVCETVSPAIKPTPLQESLEWEAAIQEATYLNHEDSILEDSILGDREATPRVIQERSTLHYGERTSPASEAPSSRTATPQPVSPQKNTSTPGFTISPFPRLSATKMPSFSIPKLSATTIPSFSLRSPQRSIPQFSAPQKITSFQPASPLKSALRSPQKTAPAPCQPASPIKSALRSPLKKAASPVKKTVTWDAAPQAQPGSPFEVSLLVTDGPLSGTTFYLDICSRGKSENHIFIGLLEDLGARVTGHFSAAVTHVLFKDGSAETLAKVREAGDKIHCVNVGFALDCEKESKRMTEAEYAVNLNASNSNGHDVDGVKTPSPAPPRRLNFTPARTPSHLFDFRTPSTLLSTPTTPNSSEWNAPINYDDITTQGEEEEEGDDKENSTPTASPSRAKSKGTMSAPPKQSTGAFNWIKSRSPVKPPATVAKGSLMGTPARKRKVESFGGIRMAPPKKLRFN